MTDGFNGFGIKVAEPKTDISGWAESPIGENAVKNEKLFEHLMDASFFRFSIKPLAGRTDGAVLNFWFVLFQDKMNEGKQLKAVRQLSII